MKHFLLILLLGGQAFGQAADEPKFVSLFNGRDLQGWVNVNCAPETWSVRDGVIFCTGRPTGALRTERQYENFVLELDWRHLSSGGNSGIFVWSSPVAAPGVPFLRAIEVQVLDHGYDAKGKNEWYTTHGDVFPIHGSTMQPFGRHNGMRSFPSEERGAASPAWNHYRIVAQDGVLRLHVNGKEVSGGENCNYRKGYLGLEAEGAPIEFRNIRLQELPASGASPENTAPLDARWKSLFTGLDLRGWKTNAAVAARWQVNGERIQRTASGSEPESVLWTDHAFGDVEFIVDCRLPKAEADQESVVLSVMVRGIDGRGTELRLAPTAGTWQRYVITVKGREALIQSQDARQTVPFAPEVSERGALGLRATGRGAIEFMNVYARDL